MTHKNLSNIDASLSLIEEEFERKKAGKQYTKKI
tara:strand:+ start:929 stop:1030 length:102 start_codon:yes stop_codon:yes gene_type:complete